MAASGAASGGRKYQLVLWGATGFTGKLVAEYLAQHAPSNFRWAIAGRSKDRLEAVLRSLPPSSADIVLADLENVPSLVAMTSSTEVLLSTAGPFFRLGLPIAQACVETATHYLDSTGEIHYEKRLLEFHERLQRAGVLFVPMCGFDCVPFDLGALLVVQHARDKLGAGIVSIKTILADFKGGISGGTLASMALAVESVPMSELQNTLALVPPSALALHKRSAWAKYPWPVWSADFGAWTVPSLMASVNESITRRSASLSSPVWGKSFSYAERTKSGNLFFAMLFSTAFFVGMLALYFRLSRALLMRFLPKPGEGPSRKVIESGHFTVQMIGETEDGRRVHATVRGIRDPGYGETAKMLAESAMCLALDRSRIPGKGGVLTSATAFGSVLIERLRAAGMTFEAK